MKSSQPHKIEIVAHTGLELEIVAAYLDRLNHLVGEVKSQDSAIAELSAQLASINEAVKDLQRSL